jgi:hypothetical protein
MISKQQEGVGTCSGRFSILIDAYRGRE